MNTKSAESLELNKVFSEEFDPQTASMILLTTLCAPNGMETFVRDFQRELFFQKVAVEGIDSLLVYSSMSTEGQFYSSEGGVIWKDKTGREKQCLTFCVEKNIGEALQKSFENVIVQNR